MATHKAALTHKAVMAAKHPGGGRKGPLLMPCGQVPGMALQVTPGGSRSWLMRYSFAGKARVIGFGPAPAISLADARQAGTAARALLASGIDPLQARDDAVKAASAAKAAAAANTFRAVAADYIAANEAAWRNPVHRRQWTTTLATYAYPFIGDMPVAVVDTAAVLAVLRPIWSIRPETASRVRGRIEAILDAAALSGMRSGDANPARRKGHIAKLLPRIAKVRQVRHHAALSVGSIPAFMAALDRVCLGGSMSARALAFAILTAARTGEVLGMAWREIDLDGAVWTVPAARMKAKRAHIVPLSAPAIAMLRQVRPLAADDASHVFPGQARGKPLSAMALEMAIRRMRANPDGGGRWVDGEGRTVTPHGTARSTFRDWVGDHTDYPREVAEAALAHTLGETEGAYRRNTAFTKRRLMMDDWAAFCYKAHIAEQIIPVKAA